MGYCVVDITPKWYWSSATAAELVSTVRRANWDIWHQLLETDWKRKNNTSSSSNSWCAVLLDTAFWDIPVHFCQTWSVGNAPGLPPAFHSSHCTSVPTYFGRSSNHESWGNSISCYSPLLQLCLSVWHNWIVEGTPAVNVSFTVISFCLGYHSTNISLCT